MDFVSRCHPSGLLYVSTRAAEEADDFDLIDSSTPSDLLECVARHFFQKGGRLSSATWRKTEERYHRMAQGEPVHRLD